MRSARSIAWRTASSASARSTTAPPFMPRASGMAEADDLDGMAPPAQHLLRRLRLEPRDQAGDLAGADVERRDQRRALGRQRLGLGGEAELEDAHARPPVRRLGRSYANCMWPKPPPERGEVAGRSPAGGGQATYALQPPPRSLRSPPSPFQGEGNNVASLIRATGASHHASSRRRIRQRSAQRGYPCSAIDRCAHPSPHKPAGSAARVH